MGEISKNSSMPNVPEIFKRGNEFLRTWCMCNAFARKDQKNQKSIWDHVKAILFKKKKKDSRGPRPRIPMEHRMYRRILISIILIGDDVQGFDTTWNEVLLSIQRVPSDDILESLYKMRILGFDQLKTVLALYEQYIEQHNSQPSYQKSRTMVKRWDVRIRRSELIIFEARNARHTGERQRETRLCWKEAWRVQSMKSKRTVHKKETLAVSANKRGKSTRSSSPAAEPHADEKRWEKFFVRKVSAVEELTTASQAGSQETTILAWLEATLTLAAWVRWPLSRGAQMRK